MNVQAKQTALQIAQRAISDLNMRLEELAISEMRGRRIPQRVRRALQRKRDEAHKIMRRAMSV